MFINSWSVLKSSLGNKRQEQFSKESHMGIIIDDQTLNGNHQPPYLMETTLDEMLGCTILYVNGFTERAFVDITSISRGILAYSSDKN